MTWRSERRHGRSAAAAAAGFTLIELIIVIVILGLMTTLITVNGTPVSPATHAREAARAIAGALRAARGEALTTDRSVSFTLDVANRRYRWAQQPTQSLPSDLNLTLLTSREAGVAGSAGQIRFDPDGSSSGGRVSILGGDRLWMVGVDWLSGRVSIVQQAR